MSIPAGRPDVLIVGGGVVGCALARELAGRGRRVTLLERGQPGEEASGAAAGLLTPQSDFRTPDPLLDLALASHRIFPDWARALEEETGQTVECRRMGVLWCALDEPEETRLRDFFWQRERGLEVASVEAPALARTAGAAVAPEVRAGLFFADEGAVDPRRLTQALASAARRRGVDVRTGTAVRRFWIEGGRCRGVETESGRMEAGCVVDAAGAWAGFDQGMAFPVPVEPVRGQMVELDLGTEAPGSVLRSDAVYLVPRVSGRVLVGSTLERVGFRKEVTAGAVRGLLDAAARLLPGIRLARFVTAWAGLRPGTPDGLPVLGSSPLEGLFFATGHYRHGILLAPITALFLAELLEGGGVPELEPFSVARFSGEDSTRPKTAEVFG
jgi:glycine oxidase